MVRQGSNMLSDINLQLSAPILQFSPNFLRKLTKSLADVALVSSVKFAELFKARLIPLCARLHFELDIDAFAHHLATLTVEAAAYFPPEIVLSDPDVRMQRLAAHLVDSRWGADAGSAWPGPRPASIMCWLVRAC